MSPCTWPWSLRLACVLRLEAWPSGELDSALAVLLVRVRARAKVRMRGEGEDEGEVEGALDRTLARQHPHAWAITIWTINPNSVCLRGCGKPGLEDGGIR